MKGFLETARTVSFRNLKGIRPVDGGAA